MVARLKFLRSIVVTLIYPGALQMAALAQMPSPVVAPPVVVPPITIPQPTTIDSSLASALSEIPVSSPVPTLSVIPNVAPQASPLSIGNVSPRNVLSIEISCQETVVTLPSKLKACQTFLRAQRQRGDLAGQGATLNTMGLLHRELGNYDQALAFYQQALVIHQHLKHRQNEGATLNNLGLTYQELGQYARALNIYQQALAIHQELKNQTSEGRTLNNLGALYRQLGQNDRAKAFYQAALNTATATNDRTNQANALHNLGMLYDAQKQYTTAIDYYQQSLTVRRQTDDRTGEAVTLNNLGSIYNRLGQQTEALTVLKQALAIFKDVGNRAGVGNTLDTIGTVYKDSGQYTLALEAYQQGLAILKAVGDRELQSSTLSNIGSLLQQQNQPVLAIVFYKQSIAVTENIRQELRSLPREQQQSYVQTVADTYRRLADLLLKQDRILEAQQVLELLKLRELEDYLHTVRGVEQPLTVLRPEQEILEKYTALQTSAIQLGQELAQLRQIPDERRTPAEQQRIAQLVALEEDMNRQFNQFVESPEIVSLVRQLSQTTQRQAIDLTDLTALRNDLQRLNAVLLYPLILDDRLELIITTPNTAPLRRSVSVKRQDLNRAIVEFRSALQSPTIDARASSQKLYNWLIKPLEADLKQANVQTIIYAPDGQLRYIPLAALYDGQQWLVQRYRVNNITAKSLTRFESNLETPPRILAGAFADETVSYPVRIGQRNVDFRGLPFARQEVENLVKLIPNTREFIDQAFSLAAIKPRLNEYTILHFATHAAFIPGQPEDSFILFGNGDRATLRDIENWSLQNVDLVVLSACETGIGGRLGNGEEILGLGYQFQNRGANAAIASLWQVDDGGTQVLMDAFYNALQTGKLSKAEALRQAQLALIRNKTLVGQRNRGIGVVQLAATPNSRAAVSNATSELSHPYYWAPFILIGNGF